VEYINKQKENREIRRSMKVNEEEETSIKSDD
jgi:hypothetical protein